MLWWTWHDSAEGIGQRFVGVPLASTVWLLVLCFVFALIFGLAVGRSVDGPYAHRAGGRRLIWRGGLVAVGVPALTTALMVVVVNALLCGVGGGFGPPMVRPATYCLFSSACLCLSRSPPLFSAAGAARRIWV